MPWYWVVYLKTLMVLDAIGTRQQLGYLAVGTVLGALILLLLTL